MPQYDAMFQRTSGWTGGDGAYSAALSNDRLLWLFGDTLVGEVAEGRRSAWHLVNNSLAIQTGKDPQPASIDFVYGSLPGELPAAFVRPEDGIGWFWPSHGVRTTEGLYLFLLQVERAEGPPGFGFRPLSSWLGHVSNPDDPAERWTMTQRKIPWSSAHRVFGTYVLTRDGQHYIFGTEEKTEAGLTSRHMLLARAPAGRIGDFSSWRFFTGGEWVATAERAAPICENIAGEFSVSFQPSLERYVLVYTVGGLSEDIVARFAPRPYGPWSRPIRLYRCPEMGRDARIFCYAGKGHSDLSSAANELIVTYIANATDFALLEMDPRLYRPRFIKVTFESRVGRP